jgi:predicted  nucleic acid-binding Zn-ribbon protein
MKKILTITALMGALLLASAHLHAQQQQQPLDPNKPDEQLTQKEGDERIKTLRDAVKALEDQVKPLDGKPNQLREKLLSLQKQLGDCDSSMYALIGASKADVEKFRERLGTLTAKVREMKQLSDDQLADQQDKVKALEDELNALRKEKIAVLPEFFPRIIDLAKEIKGLYREKKIKTYTVGKWSESRECLWIISGREEIYGDPFLWPKIWVANKPAIRNPDIIYPGQQLTIPPKAEKTDDEMKAERRYWRQKRAAAASGDKAAPQQQPIKTGTNN